MAKRVKRIVKASAEPGTFPAFDCLKEFLDEKEGTGLAEKTIKNYKQSVTYYFDYMGFDEDTPISEAERSTIFKWSNSMKIDGVKVASRNHYLRDLRTFLYWCMERKYIEEPYKVELVKGQEEELKFFPDEELELLLEKPRRSDSFVTWRTWAVVNWILDTGNRASTVVNIKLGDIDLKKKTYKILKAKNKKVDYNPLSTANVTVLKEYIRMFRNESGPDDYLFCNVGDEQLTPGALEQSFARYCRDRGCSKTNIHGLRHNFARAFVKKGGHMAKLQELLGHSTIEMSRKYVELFGKDLQEGFEELSPLANMTKNKRRTNKITKHD